MNAAEADREPVERLAKAFRNLGAGESQARVMARQTLKRARQIADERGISETEALSALLEKIVAGARGDYTGETD